MFIKLGLKLSQFCQKNKKFSSGDGGFASRPCNSPLFSIADFWLYALDIGYSFATWYQNLGNESSVQTRSSSQAQAIIISRKQKRIQKLENQQSKYKARNLC